MTEELAQLWDAMFLKPHQREAAYKLRDLPTKPDPDLRPYADLIRQQPDHDRLLNFQENLEYIHDWDQREMLGLLIEGVNLHEVNFDYLDHWRRNYQVPKPE